MRRIRTHHNHPEGKVFSYLALIYGLGIGLTLPILPNFVKTFFHSDEGVSIFYAVMAIAMFIAALSSTVIFNKFGRTLITKISFFMAAIVLLFFTLITKITELSFLETLRVWFILFIIISVSIFVSDFSKKRKLAENEGLYYTFNGIGLLIGPLLGGYISTVFGYELVFILASIVMFVGMAYFYHLHIVQKHPAIIENIERKRGGILKNIKLFFANKELKKAYVINVSFMFWIAFKRIYTPLYVLMAGYLESLSGIIISLSIVPLLFLEVAIGKYGQKKGVRIPITIGFFIISILAFVIFFNPYHFINFVLIILANLGAAFIEPLQEYYMHKNTPDDQEDNLYGIFMTADPLSYFLAPAIGAAVLFFLPFKFLFLFLAIMMFAAMTFSWFSLKRS